MEIVLTAILAVLVGLALGVTGSYLGQRLLFGKRWQAAQEEVDRLLKEAREQGRSIVLEAKEEALRIRTSGEAELRERRSKLDEMERRLSNREENLERRASNLDRRERSLAQKEKHLERFQTELEELRRQGLQELEHISGMSMGEARETLMARAEEEIQEELARRYRDLEEEMKLEAAEKARRILAQTMQRLASDVVSDVTTTTIPLPSDDMKGRLIGREGRNIRAIEKATGVNLIIDETPETVTLSCFDPVRREIARIAITRLIADGRIHPARIEQAVAKAEKEIEEAIRKAGEEAVMETGVRGLHPEILKLLGRLKYRYSFGENVLQHSIEVAVIAGMLASELGANVNIAKAGGLLHDIGKALSHEVEGPHAQVGAEVAAKYNVPEPVCRIIAEHHDDEMSSVEGFIVVAADAISAARPGARRDTVEQYMKRMEALEEVGRAFQGVEKCYAIQAGREIRVMVKPEDVDDAKAAKMARDIVKKIEETLVYPGQIKVTVIRESRSVEYAR